MLRLVMNYRNGIQTPEINIYVCWDEKNKEELKTLKRIEKYLSFNVKTYNTVRNDFTIMKPVLDVINRLTDEQKKLLFTMFYKIKELDNQLETSTYEKEKGKNINNERKFSRFEEKIEEFVDKAGNIIVEYFEKIGMIDIIRKYVEENVTFPNLDKVGTRPQDSKRTTFFKDEYLEITVLSVICKMLTPIFGEIIYWYNKSTHLDKTTKEINAIRIVNKLLNTYFPHIKDKLFYYISKRVESFSSRKRKRDEINTLFKGFDEFKFKLYIFSTIISKKLVNANLLDGNKNIMTYINKCIIDTFESQEDGLRKQNDKVMERTEMSSRSDDEQEVTLVEHESGRITHQISVLLFMRKAIEDFTIRLTKKTDINPNDFLKTWSYYYNENIKINRFSEYAIGSIINKIFNNGKAVRFLRFSDVCKLISIFQIYLIKNIYTLNEIGNEKDIISLIHLLSCHISSKMKERMSSTDYRIKTRGKFCQSYHQIKSLIHPSFVQQVDDHVEQMIITLSNQESEYITAPLIWDKYLKDNNKNHYPFEYDTDLIDTFFKFVIYINENF